MQMRVEMHSRDIAVTNRRQERNSKLKGRGVDGGGKEFTTVEEPLFNVRSAGKSHPFKGCNGQEGS